MICLAPTAIRTGSGAVCPALHCTIRAPAGQKQWNHLILQIG
jgi:hypothetical protein